MPSRLRLLTLALSSFVAYHPALGQERPSEDELFGGSSQAATPAADAGVSLDRPDEDAMFGGEAAAAPPQLTPPGTPAEGQAEPSREEAILSGPSARDAFLTEDAVDDPLRVGGQLYLRSTAQFTEGTPFPQNAFSLPSLVDVYFDARPTDRLRGMVVGRLSYDAALDPASASFLNATTATLSGTAGSTQGEGATVGRANPAVVLDQLWLRFDIARRAFITLGKQHVKWGTSRFFNPTDFLSPELKNPLAVFDSRVGASMLKLHVPWEARGWNFYAIALFDNAGPANLLGEVGAAARAEVVLGPSELGVDVVFQKTKKPRLGVDFSAGVGPVDIYGEAAIGKGITRPRYQLTQGSFDPMVDLGAQYEVVSPDAIAVSASGGVNWTFAYSDSDVLSVGAEYFYNANGYVDPTSIYPALFAPALYSAFGSGGPPVPAVFRDSNITFQPFNVGRHYAGLYAVAVAPGNWEDTTFGLSAIGNLSDRSFITRLNYFVRVLRFMQLEAFGALHLGTLGGEFRLGFDRTVTVGGLSVPLRLPPPLFDLGVGLRINI